VGDVYAHTHNYIPDVEHVLYYRGNTGGLEVRQIDLIVQTESFWRKQEDILV